MVCALARWMRAPESNVAGESLVCSEGEQCADPVRPMLRLRPMPATILVADDDEDLRRALCALLSGEGYSVVELADGASTLEFLADAADGRRTRPDALLLDFCMPGLSGIGLLRILRRFGSVPPAILITAFPDPSVEAFARSAGAVRVMHKPVESQEVLTAVRSVLQAGAWPEHVPM